jgi:hypothetical protein
MTRLSRKPVGQSRNPQNVAPGVWYYEEGRSLGFVITREAKRTLGDSIQFQVPLHRLEKTLARSPKARKART